MQTLSIDVKRLKSNVEDRIREPTLGCPQSCCTLLHMHPRTCMNGALCGLLAVPPTDPKALTNRPPTVAAHPMKLIRPKATLSNHLSRAAVVVPPPLQMFSSGQPHQNRLWLEDFAYDYGIGIQRVQDLTTLFPCPNRP